ncbi:MAG: hypothetical protein IT340_11640 [Chloroflexi bacterium]|nr:hypothetical protein [Chloroflexota bacterium]
MSASPDDGHSLHTVEVDGLWFSISPSVLPPDDSGADWVDLHRHQEGGMVVLGRFKGVAVAIDWAWQRQGVDLAAWRPDTTAE